MPGRGLVKASDRIYLIHQLPVFVKVCFTLARGGYISAIIASAISLVPTALGSSRWGFMS